MTKRVFIDDQEYTLISGEGVFEVSKSGVSVYKSNVEPSVCDLVNIIRLNKVDKTA